VIRSRASARSHVCGAALLFLAVPSVLDSLDIQYQVNFRKLCPLRVRPVSFRGYLSASVKAQFAVWTCRGSHPRAASRGQRTVFSLLLSRVATDLRALLVQRHLSSELSCLAYLRYGQTNFGDDMTAGAVCPCLAFRERPQPGRETRSSFLGEVKPQNGKNRPFW